jgi:acetyl-CoA acetyltransferase
MVVALPLAALMLASGCSSTHESEVEQVTEQLHAALRVEDGAAACTLLSEDAQEELQESGDSCEVAVLEAGLSPDGRVEKVSVYDTSAQVRYDDDVVFLSDFPEGWKVIAAGCTRQADAPYDCSVDGS